MRTVKLYYPDADISIEREINHNNSLAHIEQEWKWKYGQLLRKCTITVINEEPVVDKRKIIHIRTGEEYETFREASMETGWPLSTIHEQCHRDRLVGFEKYEFKFA